MSPHIRYRWDSETLTFKEIVPHPLYGMAMWWAVDNLKQFWYWFSHGGQVLHSPYLRYTRPKPSDIHRRLVMRWNLMKKLATIYELRPKGEIT